MKTRALNWLFLVPLIFAFVLTTAKPAAADDDDPPSRVARLSYINGDVSFSPAGTDDWVAAALNRPMTTGDKLWTENGARAELHVGNAAIRLSGQTGFSFLNLNDGIMQIRLTEGTINLRVRRLDDNESLEIDTPNLAFSVLRPGHYRINVNEAGDTTVINVPDGEGEITGGGSAYTIHPGEEGIFTGTDSLNADMEQAVDEDDFDHWSDERDLREEHAVARRYVSDDVIGYEDLDDYGGWRPVPEYGTVWFPHVATVGWAPYRYGHWAWVSPWGWTWVDDAPWGFAPFHYGRWVFVGGGWGWVPCPPRVVTVAYVRPVYAPALVAWVGGPHFAAGIGFGGGVGFGVGVNVGWFPLGPREVFVPSYHVSRTYINNVNVSNTTVNQTVVNNYYNTTVVNNNVTNVRYMNQGVHGAVTATSGQNFTSAQPVAHNMVQVNEREMATAPVAVRAPAVVPPKQAVLGSGAPTKFQPPAALQSRQVVAKTAPPPAPLPFAARQEAIRSNQGQPISIAQSHQLAAQQQVHANVAPVRVAPPAKAITNLQPGNKVVQPSVNRPANPNVSQPANTNRPPTANANANVNPNANPNVNKDHPPTSHPANTVNPELEQKHQDQIQQLQQKQDQEYQKVQQKQYQQQQQIQQQQANEEKQKQVQQKQQQQLQQLEDKHNQQQQQLQQKQAAEHKNTPPPPKEKEKEKPKNEDKPPHK
ncbi:MAG TPA: DUF6600 domain-containing protein [Candidatus Acidoferrum sp.]|nr:DUF6600 domain-containing protein [Candidatus Acidoferrum sp.]